MNPLCVRKGSSRVLQSRFHCFVEVENVFFLNFLKLAEFQKTQSRVASDRSPFLKVSTILSFRTTKIWLP